MGWSNKLKVDNRYFDLKLMTELKRECLQHSGLEANIVCLEPTCPKRGLICGMCTDEHHNHKKIPLNRFIAQAESRKFGKEKSEDNDTKKVAKKIKINLAECINKLEMSMAEIKLSTESFCTKYFGDPS